MARESIEPHWAFLIKSTPKVTISISVLLYHHYHDASDHRRHIAIAKADLGFIFLPHVVVAKIASHRLKLGEFEKVRLWADPGWHSQGFDFPFRSECT